MGVANSDIGWRNWPVCNQEWAQSFTMLVITSRTVWCNDFSVESSNTICGMSFRQHRIRCITIDPDEVFGARLDDLTQYKWSFHHARRSNLTVNKFVWSISEDASRRCLWSSNICLRVEILRLHNSPSNRVAICRCHMTIDEPCSLEAQDCADVDNASVHASLAIGQFMHETVASVGVQPPSTLNATADSGCLEWTS